MNRLYRILIPVLALLALVAVVFGVPLLLVLLVGWPLPSPIPGGEEIGDILAGRMPIPAEYLISLLAVAMWVIWAQVAWATVIEATAALSGRMAKRARMIPGVQLGVAKLVTAATLLATSLTVKPVSAGPLMPVVAGMVDSRPASTSPDDIIPVRQEQARTVPYMTRPGDTWWGIAEESLGSGTRWKEVRSLNLGRTMNDGTVIVTGTDLLKPDWRLLLPQGAAAGDLDREVVVQRGDTVWGIAVEDLAELESAGGSMAAVADHVDKISELNQDALNGNPDLIHPGQRLELPAMEQASDQPAEQPDPAPPSEAEVPEPPTLPTTDAAPTTTAAPATSVAPTTVAPPTTIPPTTIPATEATSTPTSAATSASASGDAASDPSKAEDEEANGPTVSLRMRPGPDPEPVGEDRRPDAETGGPDSDEPTQSLAGARAATAGASPQPLSIETTDMLDVDSPTDQQSSASGQFRQGSADGTDGGTTTRPNLAERAPSTVGADLNTPELNTAGQLTESDLVLSQPAGEADDLDTDNSRAPVFAGFAALTLIGAYLYRARGRRRDTALRHRPPGRRPSPPKRRTRNVARRLAAAAEPENGEFVNIGLRALSRQLQGVAPSRLPKISGVWVSHNRLVLALADDSPKSTPPEPFTEFADGSGWSLRRSEFARARQAARGANGPLPLLTTIGTTSALDLALTTNSRAPAEAYGLSSSLLFALDLEAGRVISVIANDEASTIEALTMMALELATSETADQAEIVCVGFGHRLATFDRVIVVDEISEILGDVEAITGRAVYAAGDASPFATRVGNGAADTWNPVIVFHADAADPNADALVELAGRTDGGVTAVCGYPTTLGWTLRIDGDRISCGDLPGELGHHSFKRPELDGVELIPDLFDEPWDDLELDDDFWKPMDPVEADHTWHLFDSDETSWRPMRSVTDPERTPGRHDAQPAHRSGIAVVVSQEDGEARRDPDDLWDSISAVDADSWPETEVPALRELRHSVEHLPPSGQESTETETDETEADVGDLTDDSTDADETGREESADAIDADKPSAADDVSGQHTVDQTASGHDALDAAGADSPTEPSAEDQPTNTDSDQQNPPTGGKPWEANRSRHLYVVENNSEDRSETDGGPVDDASTDSEQVDDDQTDDSNTDGSTTDHSTTDESIVGDPVGASEPTEDARADESEDQQQETDADLHADQPITISPLPDPRPSIGSYLTPESAGGVHHDTGRAEENGSATDRGYDIQVSVLGNFTIESHQVGDRAKPWKYTKTPELVLYLLLNPAGASQDLLMEQLFPEQPPNRPRLNQLVSDARTKALGKDSDGGYHLPHASPTEPFYKLLPSVGLDLRRFAQHCANARAAEALQVQQREWEAALKLVKGRPFTLPHDGYEWAIPEIEATIIKVEEAAVALTDIAFELGDYRLAVWATKKGLLTETGYYELLVKRGRAALLLQDPEEIVRAFADLQVSLEFSGAPEEGMPDLSSHPDLEQVYHELSSEGRSKDRSPT